MSSSPTFQFCIIAPYPGRVRLAVRESLIQGLEDAIKAYWEHREKVMDQKSKRDKKKLEKLNKKVKPYEGWGFAVIDF